MKRLSLETLDTLAESVLMPGYNIEEHKTGILHFGIGAFHRGHQAVFTDDALAASGGDWRIIGVSLRSDTVSKQLNPQDGLYTVSEKHGGKTVSRVIAAVSKAICAPQNNDDLARHLVDPSIKIITLTVTEKGYHFDQSTRSVDWNSKDIQHDILNPDKPLSMPGYLVLACSLRMKSEYLAASKLTIISCDNLPENGEVTRTVVMALAKKQDAKLAEWISENVSFCSSMVDRIVPKVSNADHATHIAQNGYEDLALVVTEPFKQWVIEDNFCTSRPDWAAAGVRFVTNVKDYEKLKLRTLNGAHSALAYMGVLLDVTYIHEAVIHPLLKPLVTKLMKDETGPTIPAFADFDLANYQDQIMSRFMNNDIAYETQQVASDGSLKLPQRILDPLTELYSAGKGGKSLVLLATFVCWLRFLLEETESGKEYTVVDPNAEKLTRLVKAHWTDSSALVDAVFEQSAVVPAPLCSNTQFKRDLQAGLDAIKQLGVAAYLDALQR